MKKPTVQKTSSQSNCLCTEDHPLNIPELARLFRVSPNYFYELSRKGKLPCRRIGKKKNIRIFPDHMAKIKAMHDSPMLPDEPLGANSEVSDQGTEP